MPGTENMLTLDCTTYAGCSVVRPRGTLDAGTYASLRDDLLKYAAEEPAAVLVELDALHIAREHVLSVFSLLWMRVSEWPGVPLGLLVRNGVRRENVRHTVVARYVPVYADLTEALDDQPQQPRRRRTYSVLPTTARASGNARRLVRETTRDWEIEAVSQDAQQVATELVENALKHTNSTPGLRLELRSDMWRGLPQHMLSIAVADDSPARPAAGAASPELDSGRGLHLVAEFAHTWGSMPRLPGGKIVWAVLTLPRETRARPHS